MPRRRNFAYEWPRPAVTVDVALFSVAGSAQDQRLRVLLVERALEPFRGAWALPGGFVRLDEDLADAARRELAEETGVKGVFLEQVAAVGRPGRDPRGHTVTVVYAALVPPEGHVLAASGDAEAVRWFDMADPVPLPTLAFDHAELLAMALRHLREHLSERPTCFQLLPEEFTLSELQGLCEAILGQSLDRRNFRRKLLQVGWLEPATGRRREGAHRPAQTYRFLPTAFEEYRRQARGLPF